MIQALVYHAAKGLNQFPAKNGISDTLSPLTIMTGMPMILGLLDLIPTPMKVPRHTTIPETKIPETMLPIRPWSPTQTKNRVPIGTISGATEADPTATDLITKWMTP